MELQTISAVSFIGTICSIILSIGFPIMLMIIGNRKFKAKISTFFIGAGTFILFAFVLEQLLHALVIVVLGLNPESNAWLYYVYAAVAAAVFEETGRIVAMKFFMKKRFDFPNAFMYGIGHGGIEAIAIGGIANISSLVTMIMINNGMMQASLAQMSEELQTSTFAQLSIYWTTSPALFFASGIERVSAVILHIGLSLIIYQGLKSNRKIIIAIAFGIHFMVDFFAVSCASRMSTWVIEIAVFVFAVGTFALAHKLNKETEGKHSMQDA